jgi:hypothetical protein
MHADDAAGFVGAITATDRDRRRNGATSVATLPDKSIATGGLTDAECAELYGIARETWRFFDVVVDPHTHLPRDTIHLNGALSHGAYTSPTDVGVYLWSVVAALDLGLILRREALTRLSRTLDTLENLSTWNGLLLSWYDTETAHPLTAPGQAPLDPPYEGAFISTVDNAWYAVGLIVVRQALPEFAARATALLGAMNFGVFYDAGDQQVDRTAGQMFGGYVVGGGPTAFHYSLLNTETRIAAYVGIGTGTMPGDVWWRTWRTLPPDVTWQGQVPRGYTVTYVDPSSGQEHDVFEGHYRHRGIRFVPSWGGSMFEGLMPGLIVPETTWGPTSFGRNNANYAAAHIAYATRTLRYPVWGLSPSTTPNQDGTYAAYGARALASNRARCPYAEDAVTPHASFLALDVLPRLAFSNIQALRERYPIDGPYGLFDAVNPRTGQVGPRYLVLDQAMIMAALDNALNDRALQRHFADDPIGAAVRPYLAAEEFSLDD